MTVLWLVLGALWLLGSVQSRTRSKGFLERALEANGKADDEARASMAAWASRERDEQDDYWGWKSD